jgi:hypothetical protein
MNFWKKFLFLQLWYSIVPDEGGGAISSPDSPDSGAPSPPPSPSLTDPPSNTPDTPSEPPSDVIGKGTWFEGIDKTLYDDPSLIPFKDGDGNINPLNIIKSYVHTKKSFGSDKITIPSENSSAEEWKEVYTKLGLPEHVDGYLSDVETQKGSAAEKFKEVAYNLGVLPKQAESILEWFNEFSDGQAQVSDDSYQLEIEDGFNQLAKEYGASYEQQLRHAKTAFNELADDTFRDFVEQNALHEHPQMIRFFIKLAGQMKEDTFVGNTVPGTGIPTPEQAREQINEYMSDAKGPYWNSQHMQHADVVKKVQKLYTYL